MESTKEVCVGRKFHDRPLEEERKDSYINIIKKNIRKTQRKDTKEENTVFLFDRLLDLEFIIQRKVKLRQHEAFVYNSHTIVR